MSNVLLCRCAAVCLRSLLYCGTSYWLLTSNTKVRTSYWQNNKLEIMRRHVGGEGGSRGLGFAPSAPPRSVTSIDSGRHLHEDFGFFFGAFVTLNFIDWGLLRWGESLGDARHQVV